MSTGYAEYEEWPLQAVLKRVIVGEDIHCSIGFNFKQIQDILASHGSLRVQSTPTVALTPAPEPKPLALLRCLERHILHSQ
jgi:hypothetical protein